MNIHQAAIAASARSVGELQDILAAAVARGVLHTGIQVGGWDVPETIKWGPVRLLTHAMNRLLDIALVAWILDRAEDPAAGEPVVAMASGVVWLVNRALEAHGRAEGYDPAVWSDQAGNLARARLRRWTQQDAAGPVVFSETRAAGLAITRAIASVGAPELIAPAPHAAVALGHLVAIIAIADEAALQ